MRRTFVLLAAVVTSAAGAAGAIRPVQTPVFTGRAELTVLNVVVTNRSGGYVTGLPREAFTVFEDGQPRSIALFSTVDAPATIGLLIDSSASMYGVRDLIGEAAAAFVATRTPEDEVFALTFTERVHAALPPGNLFTADAGLLERSLRGSGVIRGRTALHDAIAEGLLVLEKGHNLRRVLVVVSDGDDNASRTTFDHVARAAAASNTVIYAIGIVDPASAEGRPDRLRALAQLTGGTADLPRRPSAVRHAFARIAEDIRSAYTVGYVPARSGAGVRHVRVAVDAAGERLTARTRREYMPPEE